MEPLGTLLRPLAAVLNRQVSEQTPARELVQELEERVFAVRVRDTSLVMYVVVAGGELHLATDYPGEPDVIVRGSLLSLGALAGGRGESAIRDGSIDLSGDAAIAQKFQQLFRYARPDFEEELSRNIGDVLARGVGEAVRGLAWWGREAGATMRQNVTEYLQEESRDVPSRYEVEAFRQDVDALRDDVARIEARLDRLAAARNN